MLILSSDLALLQPAMSVPGFSLPFPFAGLAPDAKHIIRHISVNTVVPLSNPGKMGTFKRWLASNVTNEY